MHKKTLIVLVGGPCSGKSSAGKIAARNLRAEYVSSGDIARSMAEHDNDIRNDLNAGKLAPEPKMRKAVKDHLWDYFYEKNKDLMILDGFPRFGDQANWLEYEFYGIDIHYVLIHAPLWLLKERARHRGRSDDNNGFYERYNYYCGVTYRELYERIDTIIDTEIANIKECATLLEEFVKEVRKC